MKTEVQQSMVSISVHLLLAKKENRNNYRYDQRYLFKDMQSKIVIKKYIKQTGNMIYYTNYGLFMQRRQ